MKDYNGNLTKKPSRISLHFILIFFVLITSCSLDKSSKNSSLNGNWYYTNSKNIDSFFLQDLIFKENGRLLSEDGNVGSFLLSAPGYLNITMGEHSGFLKFELTENNLKLYLANGYAIYTRQEMDESILQKEFDYTPVGSKEESDNDLGGIASENTNKVELLKQYGIGNMNHYSSSIDITTDWKYLALPCGLGICLYTLPDFQEVSHIGELRISSVTFSPDGNIIASGRWDDTIRLWDVQTGKERLVLDWWGIDSHVMIFSPDGKSLASLGKDYNIHLWDIQTGQQQAVLEGHTNQIHRLAYSPDGSRLASASEDETVRIWDVQTGQQIQVHEAYHPVYSVAFSPDGGSLAS